MIGDLNMTKAKFGENLRVALGDHWDHAAAVFRNGKGTWKTTLVDGLSHAIDLNMVVETLGIMEENASLFRSDPDGSHRIEVYRTLEGVFLRIDGRPVGLLPSEA